MSLAAAPTSLSLTPTAFSQRLLEAASLDARRNPQERTQLDALLRPFAGAEVDARAFESALRDRQRQDADLGEAAREVLALWRLCSRYGMR
ncbi:MAG TPA: hypothetical protein VFE37_19955 [Chloroflexota bacterium]|nr:hypothetical protein [Chloroflexota bacterium]